MTEIVRGSVDPISIWCIFWGYPALDGFRGKPPATNVGGSIPKARHCLFCAMAKAGHGFFHLGTPKKTPLGHGVFTTLGVVGCKNRVVCSLYTKMIRTKKQEKCQEP